MAQELVSGGADLSDPSDLDPFAGVDLSLPSGAPQAPAPVAALEADPFAGVDLSLSPQAAPSVRPIDSSDPFAGIDLSVGVSPPADADFLSSLRQQAVSIPGLAIQDGKFAKLPDSLPSVASPELAANAGELSLDQLNSELRRASYKYSRTRDIEKRTQILGEFIQNWNPEKAKELGIGQDGYIKPTGLWKVLDLVDIVFDRPVRVLGESLYEYKETQAANTLQGKDTSIKQLASLLSQNWDEDRGRLGEGGQAIKSWALWATSPLSIDTPQEAQEFFRRSDAYDAGEQELADSIVTGWHRLAGTVKGKSRQEIEQIVDESIAQGAQGGQATIDLVGMMGASLLNLAGLGPFKGALTGVSKAAAARRASNLGLKYNPLGNARLKRMEVEAMPRARAQMIEDLTGSLRQADDLAEAEVAAQVAVKGLRVKSDELKGIEDELLSLRKQSEAVEAGRLEGIDDAVLARSIDETADRYKAANEAFEEEFLSLAKIEGTPVSSGLLFDDIQARAARMAAWDVADATEMSLRYNIKSGAVGARAASILAEAKLAARAVDGEPVLQVERLWADAMENAEKGKKVLVDLGLDLSNPAKPIAKPVFMTSSEARVFENAKDGVYGMKAQVASYYPQDMGVMVRSVGGEAKFKSLVRQAGDEIIRIAEGPSIRGVGRRAVKRGVQAARGMSKSERIFDADRMITNVEPFSFKINHAIASQIPWIERFRVPVAGVLSMTRRPMHYARKGEDGKWVPIKRNEMVHPTRFYRATLAERQRLTDMSVLRSEWPVWRAKMEAVGGDMAIINMGRKVYELGWASPEAAMATADDLLKVVAIENLQKVADELARMGAKREVVLGQGRVVTVLPAEDIEKARSSIAALDGVNVNTSELSKLIDEYEEMTTPLAGELAILSESEKKARAAYIENLRSLTNNLYAATQASVLNRVKFQSELAVGKIADDFVPELDSISKQINSIDEQLSAVKVTGEGAEEALSAAKSQLDEAFRVLGLGADDVGKARLLREMDPYVSAYRGSLSDFKKRMGDELGEEAAEVAGDAVVKSGAPLSDTAQAYIDSVRVAWAGGKEVPVLSLFDSMWDNARAILDPSLLGRKSMFALKLPGGVKKSLNELAESSRAVDAARINVAEASPAKLADAEATLAEAVGRNNNLRDRYGTKEVSMPRPPKGKDLVHAPGSESRQVLEALRLHYTNRMASINAQVATEAHDIRVASTDAIKELQERLTRQGLVPEGKEKELSEALQRLSEAMFGREVSVSLAGTKDLSADILLRRAVSRSRRVKDPAARAQILSQELGKVQARLAKVGDEKNISDLQRALNEMDELRAKKKSMKEVKPQFTKAVEQEIDNLLKKVDELDFDLRHPDDASRQLIGKLDSAYNNLEAGAGLYQARLRALRDADVSDLIPGMSAQQKARVVALLKNPKLRNKLIDEDLVKLNPSLAGKGGRTILVKETQAALAAARTRLDKYIADGAEEAIEKQRGNVARLERELEILGTEADVDKVLQVAELMKRFFDENLERLKTSGVLDEAFNADEFFARVDVGAYFPHMLSQASRKRFEALGAGSGARVGRTISNYFSKKREIGGVVDDINEAGRAARAEKILHHAAKNGEYGEAAASAAARGQSAFKAFVKESGQDYATLVDEIKEGALLSQFDELFETDPFVVMDYYHRKASQAVADARFINTTLDLFPAGRLIAQLPVNEQAKAAESMGYVRLSEVEYLEATLQQQLPKGLRSLTPTLKAHVASGASLEDIKKLVFAELGSEIDPDILTALSSNKIQLPYVPVQIKEYLNWRNSADALIIKKTVGSEVWDGLQAWAKTQATVVALAHIGRNFIGNTISTVQELGLGAINPFTQMTAMRIWGTWGDKNLNQIIEIGGREMTVKGWREFFSSRGFFDNALSTDFLAEMGVSSKAVPTNQTLVRQLTGTSVGAVAGMALGSAFGMGAPGFFFGGALGMKAGKKWSGVKAVRGDKAYKRFQEGVVDELKNSPREGVARVANEATGAIVGGIIGSAAFGAGAIPGAILGKQNIGDFIQMMGGLNRAAESQARLSTAIGLMKRGVDPDEALVRVNRSLRDYSDLTPLEKGVFRRFFFFYTWEAGNIKYQLQWMRERPRTVRALSAFTKGVYQMQFTDEELANLPETYRYPIVVRSGAAKLIALSGLPHQPMLEVLTRQKEGFPMQGLMTRIHPAILSFLELTAGGGRSFYYGRPIKELNNINQLKHAPPLLKVMMGYPDSPNYYVPIYKNGVKTNRTRAVRKSESPVLYYLAQKLPGYRWMNEYFKISSDSFNSYALESALTPEDVAEARATHFERAMMFGFGLKQTAIDWDYESYKMSKEFEERMLDQIEAAFPRAVGTRRYLRKELSARPSPDLEELE